MRIFGSKWNGNGLHDEKLHSLYRSPKVLRVIESRTLRWAEYVVGMEEGRKYLRILIGKPTGKRSLERRKCKYY